MIELTDNEGTALLIRPPTRHDGFDPVGVLYARTDSDPTKHTLGNNLAQFVVEEDDVGGAHLKEFRRAGGSLWTNREGSLWRLTMFRPHTGDEEYGDLHLDPVAVYFSTSGVTTTTEGSTLVLTWTDVPIGADTLTVTQTLKLNNGEDFLRSTISVVWSSVSPTQAVDSVCQLPLRIDGYPQTGSPTDFAAFPAFWGVLVKDPTQHLLYNHDAQAGSYGPSRVPNAFSGRIRHFWPYPSGDGWTMAFWAYYDSVAKEGWMTHLEDHSDEFFQCAFQGNWGHMSWEGYVPQENLVTAGNGSSTLGMGYTVCLRAYECTTSDGWWDAANFYKARLDATAPVFRANTWKNRTDRHAFEREPFVHMHFEWQTPVGITETDVDRLTTEEAAIRSFLGISSTTPIFGFGSATGNRATMTHAYEDVANDNESHAMFLEARARNMFLGIHKPNVWFPKPWSIYKFGTETNWWGEHQGEFGLQTSRGGALLGDTTDTQGGGRVGEEYFKQRSYVLASYDALNKTVTLVGSPLTVGEWGSGDLIVFEHQPTGRLLEANVQGNSASDVATPTSEIKLSTAPKDHLGQTLTPVSGAAVHLSTPERERQCWHAYRQSLEYQNLIAATWGGNYDLHAYSVFYADVHTAVGASINPPQISCASAHGSWQELDSSYVPHPQVGGSFWREAIRGMLQDHRDYIEPKHLSLRGTNVMHVWVEYADEGVIPQVNGNYHVFSCMGLYRGLSLGETNDDSGALDDDCDEWYRMCPLYAVVHAGRVYGKGVSNMFGNGILLPSLGREDAGSQNQRLRKMMALWLSYEWPWGCTPAYYNSITGFGKNLEDLNIWDDDNWDDPSHPLGVASEEIRSMRALWKKLVRSELTWALDFLQNGDVRPPATVNPASTIIDMVAYGVFDQLSLLGLPAAAIGSGHGFSGPLLYDKANMPACSHAVWQDPVTGRVAVFVVNWTNAEATFDFTLDFSAAGLSLVEDVRAFQVTEEGMPGLVGDFAGSTGNLTVVLDAFDTTAFVFAPVSDTINVPAKVGNLQAQATLLPGELKVTWELPGVTTADAQKYQYPQVDEVILVRRQGTYPTSITDGTEVFRTSDGILEYLDTGLQPDTVYYYAAFINDGSTVTAT